MCDWRGTTAKHSVSSPSDGGSFKTRSTAGCELITSSRRPRPNCDARTANDDPAARSILRTRSADTGWERVEAPRLLHAEAPPHRRFHRKELPPCSRASRIYLVDAQHRCGATSLPVGAVGRASPSPAIRIHDPKPHPSAASSFFTDFESNGSSDWNFGFGFGLVRGEYILPTQSSLRSTFVWFCFGIWIGLTHRTGGLARGVNKIQSLDWAELASIQK